ncbi:hypothetical protein [Chryseobacterium kwangjuense]|uniref:DUF4156 domain-containing protein n=1 Tax=Chryseobacterium kwangjuense TaxID=267125 RepID=A0A135WF79_9FLAO|nr:hypothetical protein [Chryseobacterium kwangjuense]KXH83412.1 hypothetical protein AU378_13525 [Chryseobacterium kwangjuense]
MKKTIEKLFLTAIALLISCSVFAIQPAGRGISECGLAASVRMYSITLSGVKVYANEYLYFNSIADAEQYITQETNRYTGGELMCHQTGPHH